MFKIIGSGRATLRWREQLNPNSLLPEVSPQVSQSSLKLIKYFSLHGLRPWGNYQLGDVVLVDLQLVRPHKTILKNLLQRVCAFCHNSLVLFGKGMVLLCHFEGFVRRPDSLNDRQLGQLVLFVVFLGWVMVSGLIREPAHWSVGRSARLDYGIIDLNRPITLLFGW